ncbi:cyclic nucleotide-binding domain-containing protein, partial [Acetobacter fabarum]
MTEAQSTRAVSASALDRNLSARQLSTAHVTRVQNLERSPRWLHLLLPWVNVGGGVFRVNRRRLVSSRFGGVLFTGEGDAARPVPESLRALPEFSQATDAQIHELVSKFQHHTHPDGADFTLPEGTLALVASGAVQHHTNNGAARTVRHLFAAPGQHFVAPSGLGSKELRAVGKTTLLTLPPEQIASTPWLKTALTAQDVASRADVNQYGEAAIQVLSSVDGEPKLPTTFVDYQDHPREYYIHSIQTVLRTHTRITDLYSNEFDQLREQVRVVIDVIREREEWELLNNPEFGLLNETAIAQRVP